MKANLHTHSYFSDGSESPERVAELAAQAGVGIAALSDHNTFAGCERFAEACRKRGIRPIQAVEIDCTQPEIGFRSELLAYFPNGGGNDIEPLLARKSSDRKQRIINTLIRIQNRFGIDNTLFCYDYLHQWVLDTTGYNLFRTTAHTQPATLYLPYKQMYRFLTERWNVELPDYETLQELRWWRELWSVEGIAPSDTLYDTIRAVTQAGGYAVLPHFGFSCKLDPDHMHNNSDHYLEQLKSMQALGLWGLEIHPYRYKTVAPAVNAQISAWATELGLELTAGSDFHGFTSTHHIFDAMSFDFNGFPKSR